MTESARPERLTTLGWTRRRILAVAATLASVGTASPAAAGVFFWGRMFSVPPRDTPFVTPIDQFYRVNYSDHSLELGAAVRPTDWSLLLHGAVEHPRTLRFVDVLEQRVLERMVTLACIDNEPGGSLISNADWSGFPVARLLDEAKPWDTAVDVVFRGIDGYHDSIALGRAMSGDVLLAHSMNGIPLPKAHGFPLRAIVPGVFGIKNVKWLTEIEVVERDYLGYWQERGWTDDGLIPVTSRIDSPGHYQVLRGKRQVVRGIAFGGSHGIGRVELSVDAGRTWREAAAAPSPPDAWTHWSYEWEVPARGAYTLLVRAEGRDGTRQVEKMARAYPSGTSGLHTVVSLIDSV